MRRSLRRKGNTDALDGIGAGELVGMMQDSQATAPNYAARLRGAYRTKRPQWVEVSLEYYEQTLEALPPAEARALGHIMGEVFEYSQDGGESIWLCFLQVSDRQGKTRYVGRICTRNEWAKTYHSATWESSQGIK